MRRSFFVLAFVAALSASVVSCVFSNKKTEVECEALMEEEADLSDPSVEVADNEAVGMFEADDESVAVSVATDEARMELVRKMNMNGAVLHGCVPVQTQVIYDEETSLFRAYVRVRMEE